MPPYRFSAAADHEDYVFGSQRPGYGTSPPISDAEVAGWMEWMQQQGIQRICCLLEDQLSLYASDLLEAYRSRFGQRAVCWAPIADYHLADETLLIDTALPFLADAVASRAPVVVHCSGGIGRTGHVLAAWLVYARGMTNDAAIQAVIRRDRNPYEAEGRSQTGKQKLHALLDACRAAAASGSGSA